MEQLSIGNYGDNFQNTVYNRFFGSLKPLENLSRLKRLDIENTDIDSDSEYLPFSVKEIYCFSKERPKSRVKEVERSLNSLDEFKFVADVGKYIRTKINAQKWLDKEYPKNSICLGNYDEKNKDKKRKDIGKINIEIRSSFSFFQSSGNLDLELKGELRFEGFDNLEELTIKNKRLWWFFEENKSEITNLDLTGLEKLKKVKCYDNYLSSFNYSALNPDKLSFLNITANNLLEQDLSVFSKFVNLETLWIGNDNKEHFTNDIYNKLPGNKSSHCKPCKQFENGIV